MAIPSAKLTVAKGGLGIIQAPPTTVHVVIGPASKGPLFTPLNFNDPTAIATMHGCGLMPKAAAYPCAQTGAPVVGMRIPTAAVAAFKSAVVKTGTGTSVVTVSGPALDGVDVVFTVTTGGTIGTSASYTLSLDGGATTGAITSLGVATTLVLAGTGLTLNFGAGTLVAGDTIAFYALPASQAVLPITITRVATSTCVVTETAAAPNDAYEVLFQVVTAGTIGVAGITFKYSLDAGGTFSAVTSLGTSTTIALLDGVEPAGLTLSLAAGTLDVGDTVAFRTTAPGYAAADVVTALTALDQSAITWSFIHVAGETSVAQAGTIGAKMTALENASTYSFCAMSARDWGTSENHLLWSSRLAALWSSFANDRISVAGGMERITCPITSRSNRRSVMWATIARLLSRPVQEDPGRKSTGPLTSDVTIYDANNILVEHDARFDSTLHDARFLTHRSYKDTRGVFVTRGNMAYSFVDFSRIAQRRVMDIASAVYRVAMEEQIEEGLLVNPAGNPDNALPGSVREEDCRRIEREIGTALYDAIVKTGMASDVQAQVSRTDTPLTNGGVLSSIVAITGLAYIDSMTGVVRYVSPKLVAIQSQAS
jgi:hypothetical protein